MLRTACPGWDGAPPGASPLSASEPVCRGQEGEGPAASADVSPGDKGNFAVPGPGSGCILKWTHQGKPGPPLCMPLYVRPGRVPRRPRPTRNESSVWPEYETADSLRLSLWRKRGWWKGARWARWAPTPTPRAGPSGRDRGPAEALGGLRWPGVCRAFRSGTVGLPRPRCHSAATPAGRDTRVPMGEGSVGS